MHKKSDKMKSVKRVPQKKNRKQIKTNKTKHKRTYTN